MDPAIKSALVDRLPEARLMSACYDLCAGEGSNLIPAIPDDFPWPDGFKFLCRMAVSDRVLFFSETSFAGLIAESDAEFLVVILGTHNALEWVEDLTAMPHAWTTDDGCACSVETGFLQVYQSITIGHGPDAMTLPSWLEMVAKGTKPVRVVGHSLGAAVGALAAADCAAPLFTLFAMPKPGDLALSKHIAGKARPGSVVIRNVQDSVPMAPPFPIYQSVLQEICFNSDEIGVSGDIGDRHRMPTCYLPACTP